MNAVKQAIDDRIRELYKIHGRLTPDIVIEDAKDNGSPLHSQFEWDVNKAALEAWRDKARELIRSVTVTVVTESKVFSTDGYHPPEFVRDPSAGSKQQGYRRIHDVRKDRDIARVALLYEIDRINAALTRARGICIELGLESEYQIVDDAVKDFREKAFNKEANQAV